MAIYTLFTDSYLTGRLPKEPLPFEGSIQTPFSLTSKILDIIRIIGDFLSGIQRFNRPLEETFLPLQDRISVASLEEETLPALQNRISAFAPFSVLDQTEPDQLYSPRLAPHVSAASSTAEEFSLSVVTHMTQKPIQTKPKSSVNLSMLDDARKNIKRLITDNLNDLIQGHYENGFTLVGRGHHVSVFSHTGYPHFVFRLLDLTQENSAARAAAQLSTSDQARKLCLEFELDIDIPAAELLSLSSEETADHPSMIVFVEEFREIPSVNCQEEVWYRILSHLPSATPIFKQNLKAIIRQCATLIIQLGYWDVSFSNFPLLINKADGIQVLCIDFENISKEDKGMNIRTGLTRLYEMFPYPELTQEIDLIATQFGVNMGNNTESLQAAFELVEAKKLALAFHSTKEVAPLPSPLPFSIATHPDFEAQAKFIMKKIEQRSEETANTDKGLLISRKIDIQPYLGCEGWTRASFVKTIEALKSNGIIASYVEGSTSQGTYMSYTIFF